MSTSILDHPFVLLAAALGVPFVAVTIALLLAKALGWFAHDRRRGALVVAVIACLYFGLAVWALETSSSPRGAVVYALLGVLWTGLAWYNRLGPGARG